MLTFSRIAVLSTLLLSVSALTSPALDGPAAASDIQARDALLALRQNIIYCGATEGTTYCTDSVCCGTINCMPAGAQCCNNGQYCLAGTPCVIDGNAMKCQDSGSSSNPNSEKTTNAGGRIAASGAALVVAGAVGLLLWGGDLSLRASNGVTLEDGSCNGCGDGMAWSLAGWSNKGWS